jgi:hypothetical protein
MGKTVCFITHASVIRRILGEILEIPLKNVFRIPCNYSGVSKIYMDNERDYAIEYLDRVENE